MIRKGKIHQKVIVLFVALFLTMGTFAGCSNDKDGEVEGVYIEGFSASETAAVEELLLAHGITPVKSVKVELEGNEDNPFASLFQPYDITGEDGKVYRVPVNLVTNAVVAIVDQETSDIIYSYAMPEGEDESGETDDGSGRSDETGDVEAGAENFDPAAGGNGDEEEDSGQ